MTEHPDEYAIASQYYRKGENSSVCSLLTALSGYEIKCDHLGDCRRCTLAMSVSMAKLGEEIIKIIKEGHEIKEEKKQ